MLHTRIIALLIGVACAASMSAAQSPTTLPNNPRTPLPSWTAKHPNIVLILCDDLGIGDVHAYNTARGKIPTPTIDHLMTEGMAFTDAHSSSSFCTPSRYAIMTGRYDWRTRLQNGNLLGNSPPLIAPDRMTVASLLKTQGYNTAAFGKWHLGLGFGPNPYADKMTDTPVQHGFDHFFGIPASLDMEPLAFIEDDHWVSPPVEGHRTKLKKQPSAIDFDESTVLPTLIAKASDWLKQQSADKPFFLYMPLTSPHKPLLPSAQFKGKTGLGDYGDWVMETDYDIGQLLSVLDEKKFADNTLVIFASDNGCAPTVNVKGLEAMGHYPSAQYRGYKSDIWEGGHREPLVVRWPGVVKAGEKSDQTVSLADLLATFAQITGQTLPPNAGEDSFSLLPILLGQQQGILRITEVNHSMNGNFALRKGSWKLELCAGSGGLAQPTNKAAIAKGLPPMQLYDLANDPSETTNLQAEHPEIVKELLALLEQSVSGGRTTPGPVQKNDAPIDLWKLPKPTTAPAEIRV